MLIIIININWHYWNTVGFGIVLFIRTDRHSAINLNTNNHWWGKTDNNENNNIQQCYTKSHTRTLWIKVFLEGVWLYYLEYWGVLGILYHLLFFFFLLGEPVITTSNCKRSLWHRRNWIGWILSPKGWFWFGMDCVN